MFKNHPKGLIAAALSNMGERFGYYIMNAVLLLFIASKFGISDTAAGWIYAVFYFLIYVLSLPGGIIADRTKNYKGTIMTGLSVMAVGYLLLSIPILSTKANIGWLLPFTCLALFIIAAGNGLFKGNLQAIIGQMYDNFEAEAAKEGPEALKIAKSKRDSGFQIFYVFINIGGLIAPFVAPLLRSWWLKTNGLLYNSELPKLCHKFIDNASSMTATDMDNLSQLVQKVSISGTAPTDMLQFCTNYLDVFNTGIHYSFIASVVAMLISLTIFIVTKKILPTPVKKSQHEVEDYTPEDKTTSLCTVCRVGCSDILLVLVPSERSVAFGLCSRLCKHHFCCSRDMAEYQSSVRYLVDSDYNVDFQHIGEEKQSYIYAP